MDLCHDLQCLLCVFGEFAVWFINGSDLLLVSVQVFRILLILPDSLTDSVSLQKFRHALRWEFATILLYCLLLSLSVLYPSELPQLHHLNPWYATDANDYFQILLWPWFYNFQYFQHYLTTTLFKYLTLFNAI